MALLDLTLRIFVLIFLLTAFIYTAGILYIEWLGCLRFRLVVWLPLKGGNEVLSACNFQCSRMFLQSESLDQH